MSDKVEKVDKFFAAGNKFEVNRLLFELLSDDEYRGELYRRLLNGQKVFQFQSRADTKERVTDDKDSVFHQDVYLVTGRDHIATALKDAVNFSNTPYRVLGSGTFMLGLDTEPDHQLQRKFAGDYLNVDPPVLNALARVAFLAGALLPFKLRGFDLAELAEQIALRFFGFLFGYEQADHALMEKTMRAAFRGLNYQIVGRHFVSEPGAIQEASANMGALLKRTAELIDLFRVPIGRDAADEREKIDKELEELRLLKDRSGAQPLLKFDPVLRRIARQQTATEYSGTELAVVVVGLIAGAIGNVQSAVAIAINEFFKDAGRFDKAREAAKEAMKADAGSVGADGPLSFLIWEALRLNPPAAFLPRRAAKNVALGATNIPEGRVVILAMGSAARDLPDRPDEFVDDRKHMDPHIFGGHKDGPGFHQCVGQHLVMPLVVQIVKRVLLLPGLAPALDPQTGTPFGLKKLWGIICQSYPMEFKRGDLLTQSPLIVIMKVKTPVSEHAEALKKVIRSGAPRIEKKLRDAKHVHFASFVFVENDTKLVLHTIYDGDFDSYIEHFALEIGSLFDRIFEHIQDAPPMPVDKFPKEFVDTIRRYNARPAGDYFFSAYPRANVSMIDHEFNQELP